MARSWSRSAVVNVARLLGLDVEDADDGVVPDERHREHRGDEPALVDAADPQEARLGRHVRDDHRTRAGRDVAGHALAEGHAGPADLEAIEAVGRGQGQLQAVTVEQVERADIGLQGVARTVDDRLQQLVPGPGGRRQADDSVQELELPDRRRRHRRRRRRGVAGLGRGSPRRPRYRAYENGPGPNVAPRFRAGCEAASARRTMGGMTPLTARSSNPAVRAEPRRSARPVPGTRWRARSSCSAHCSARSSSSRPDAVLFGQVEAIRRRTIALRATDDPAVRARLGSSWRRSSRGSRSRTRRPSSARSPSTSSS